MDISSEREMLDHLCGLNYLVVYPDRSTKIYKSLRDIQKDISIDSSTISKRLKDDDSAILSAKGTGYVFWVKRL